MCQGGGGGAREVAGQGKRERDCASSNVQARLTIRC
jgi:hypothetical protein